MSRNVIEVENVVTRLGGRMIHEGVSLHVQEGEIYAILGASGSGKTVLLKEMIMLLQPLSGTIRILGDDLRTIGYKEASALRRSWGVLFQFGALFTSLTVAENIALPLKEFSDADATLRDEIVLSKLQMVGLKPEVASLYPSELSGGMIKRAALARALAMDPKLLFLDEPTSGLDPVGARRFDALIEKLRDTLGVTVVMITHDIETIRGIVDRMAILAEKRTVAEGSLQNVLQSKHAFVKAFFKDINV